MHNNLIEEISALRNEFAALREQFSVIREEISAFREELQDEIGAILNNELTQVADMIRNPEIAPVLFDVNK